ncbi:hypothetical protein KEM48_011754 [Puccinia striiformis f. sp. tritici PST-130]|nr:hypothetical protein KEM48_011754 [Puccinia striiformis f. sp. tritici PST-130]
MLTSLKSRIFGERDELLKLLQPNPTPPEGTQSELNASPNDSDSDGDAFNYYPTNGDTIEVNTELEHYNNGDFPLDKKVYPSLRFLDQASITVYKVASASLRYLTKSGASSLEEI